MDLKIITVYCLCDDVLAALGVRDDAQCRMTLSEVMTVGIVAGLFYQGNIRSLGPKGTEILTGNDRKHRFRINNTCRGPGPEGARIAAIRLFN